MDIPAIPSTGPEHGAAIDHRLRDAARDFEALLLHELTKESRSAQVDDDPLIGGGNADGIWRDLFHARLGERAAGSIGIADLLLRDLQRKGPT
jgi:Rod binding domain-containing protein